MDAPSSLSEYVAQQNELEAQARSMFPYSFDTCSFHQDYVKQQVFACRTCEPIDEETQRGGVCYSCSISCHGDHELIEIFNKRHFKCDCGTDRVGTNECFLRKDRQVINKENVYNQNFDNKFCFCGVDYKPETEQGTMFQCMLCEDWFHDRCIESNPEDRIPEEDEFDQFVCRTCLDEQSWLKRYINQPLVCASSSCLYTEKAQDHKETENQKSNLKRETLEATAEEPDSKRTKPNDSAIDTANRTVTQVREKKEERPILESKELAADTNNESAVHQATTMEATLSTNQCIWKLLKRPQVMGISMYLREDFRDHICHCEACVARASKYPIIMEDEEVYDPPLDTDDSEHESLYDAGTRALESLPRDKMIEGVLAFNGLKDGIRNFLKPFAERGEIVTADAVKEYFASRSDKK